jgi:hypothetical protein
VAVIVTAAASIAFMLGRLLQHNEEPRPQSMSDDQFLAASSTLSDDAAVIGVSAGGKHRAYPLRLVVRREQHVLNDLMGYTAVTVTYCDLDNCVRVFGEANRRKALDVDIGGADPSRPRKMVIRVGTDLFWQDTGLPFEEGSRRRFPYERIEYERTTWGQWRAAHPDSDVYHDTRPPRQ